MSNAASTSAPAADVPKAKKGRKGLVLIATATLVLLLGGGGAAYWMLAGSGGDAEAAAEAASEDEPPKAAGAAVALDPFVVNLADPGGSRFLRVTLSLIVEDEAHALELGENELVKMRVRSAILELLAQQMADRLVTPDGKGELKKAIAEGAARVVEGLHVNDVLFSEFIVQF